VFPVELPPLRNQQYDWPGNEREGEECGGLGR
jgi:hypothetical protein